MRVVDKIIDKFDSGELFRYVDNEKLSVNTSDNIDYKGLYLWKYTKQVQSEDLWDNTLLQCRGLITNVSGVVIARPYNKFFNSFELDENYVLPSDEPEQFNNVVLFRNWQINRPFVNNNTMSKILLTHEQIEYIRNSTIFKKVFTDIDCILDNLTENNIYILPPVKEEKKDNIKCSKYRLRHSKNIYNKKKMLIK